MNNYAILCILDIAFLFILCYNLCKKFTMNGAYENAERD